jgi:hypothetical protein
MSPRRPGTLAVGGGNFTGYKVNVEITFQLEEPA